MDAFAPLLSAVLLGVVVYIGCSALLWASTGRQAGAENWLLEQVKALWNRFRRGHTPSSQ